jgi:HAD superfamily hydrolase (TIGR01509 family)
VGALKPDEAFFKRGADLLRLNVEECLFTDDRPENVAAANASGIAAFQFKSVASLKLDLLYHGIRV